MKAEVVLTVSESKRLIAKGIAALDQVREKMDKGIIVVTSGTTNGYVYEELTGQTIDKRAYVTGRTTPAKAKGTWQVEGLADLVLVDGKPDPSLDRLTALAKMKPGDIYIKGANALNYQAGIAGITIGHPVGGTIGGAIGKIVGGMLNLLVPVGLEKEVPFDILAASEIVAEDEDTLGKVHALWPVQGNIFTEIEAFDVLCNVDALPIAAGGVAGAEGGIRMLLLGNEEDVREAVALIESIQGEPSIV